MKLNEKEAQAELAKQKKLKPISLCPLMAGDCDPECINFEPPEMVAVPDKYGEEAVFDITRANCQYFKTKVRMREPK